MFLLIAGCLLLNNLQHGVAQRNGDLRLMNGSVPTQYSGRLEIYDSAMNSWGTICIEGFIAASANTSCKQLGYAGLLSFSEADEIGYGVGSGAISLTQVQCGDDDSHILRCSVMYLNTLAAGTTCNHGQDVAVECMPAPAFQYEGGVRLVDGPYSSEGILEVFIFGAWYTICTESFPVIAATAVCTQLGYTTNVGINSRPPTNSGSPVWMTTPECPFPVPCFSRCYSKPLSINDSVEICSAHVYITCDFEIFLGQSIAAGTTPLCQLGPTFGSAPRVGDLRLQKLSEMAERSGRLELYDGTEWGTICSEGFTMESANTACRQLGYSEAHSYGEADLLGFGIGNGPIHLTEVRCDSDDNHILPCSIASFTSLLSSCNHQEDIAVQCASHGSAFEFEGGVRLVGGLYQSEGILEVFIFGGWFAPCALTFHDIEGLAVCHQLGYTSVVGVNIVTQVSSSPSWMIPPLQCDPLLPCFSSCYVRPSSVMGIIQTCEFSTHVYVTCDFIPSLNQSVTFGSTSQCKLAPAPPSDAEESSPVSTAGKAGIGIGIGIVCIVIIIIVITKSRKK